MKRNIENELRLWLKEGKDALLVTGARQIGKTYIIRKVLRDQGMDYVELNFIEQPELIGMLEEAADTKGLIARIGVAANRVLEPGKTILFFDEVQECKDILTRIKFLVEDERYRCIMSGSLLGVELHDLRSAPVGYMRTLEMYPMTLFEFLEAIGVKETTFELIKESFRTFVPVDEFIHKKLIEAVYLYLITGGMPEAVKTYIETNDLMKVAAVQEKIIGAYKQDFTKYEERYKLLLRKIYDTIPSELEAENKRFFISHVDGKKAYDRVKDNFIWLKNAGVALPVYNVSEPKSPLKICENRKLFKLFLSDVGLLTNQYPPSVRIQLLSGNGNINNGGLFENLAAQELFAKGLSVYYFNSKKLGEIDLCIELDGNAVPIEIKSGKDYMRHSALDNVMSEENYAISRAYVFSSGNVEVIGKVIYLPIYMIGLLDNMQIEESIYRLDLGGI